MWKDTFKTLFSGVLFEIICVHKLNKPTTTTKPSQINQWTNQPTKLHQEVLLQNLVVPQLVKKFPYRATQMFIPVFSRAFHLSLIWALTHSTTSHPSSVKTNINMILPTASRSSKQFLSFRFPHQNPEGILSCPICATCSTYIRHQLYTLRNSPTKLAFTLQKSRYSKRINVPEWLCSV